MFSGGGYDEKIDLWAVGVIMYELISGKNPFFSMYTSDTI
jgi:serine/threonine protein kinase